MRDFGTQALTLCLMVSGLSLPAGANRLTLEVWRDRSPDHVVSCTFALSDGWLSLVRVTGAGMPGRTAMRWRASRAEVDALSAGLQALVDGDLATVDPYTSRQLAAPFLSVTWMTRLDDRLVTGLFMQPGLTLPGPLSQAIASLGIDQPCGLSATDGG